MLHKSTFLVAVLFAISSAQAQYVIGFEDLEVPESGYFNGSVNHSGTLSQTERFDYTSEVGVFRVYYTPENGYDYWSGTAYSNQTDLETADWTNFSAYADYPNGGGAEGTDNYAIGYMYNADTVSFQLVTCQCYPAILGMYVSNSVWAYRYMAGTDGSGFGMYETGDYYKLIFKNLGSPEKIVEFYLADFTNGNSYIIDDWTWVDLSTLGICISLEISYETSDPWTPTYYCADEMQVDYTSEIENVVKNEIQIFPNPVSSLLTVNSDFMVYSLEIKDLSGRIQKTEHSNVVSVADLSPGIYFATIHTAEGQFTRKFIKQ